MYSSGVSGVHRLYQVSPSTSQHHQGWTQEIESLELFCGLDLDLNGLKVVIWCWSAGFPSGTPSVEAIWEGGRPGPAWRVARRWIYTDVVASACSGTARGGREGERGPAAARGPSAEGSTDSDRRAMPSLRRLWSRRSSLRCVETEAAANRSRTFLKSSLSTENINYTLFQISKKIYETFSRCCIWIVFAFIESKITAADNQKME